MNLRRPPCATTHLSDMALDMHASRSACTALGFCTAPDPFLHMECVGLSSRNHLNPYPGTVQYRCTSGQYVDTWNGKKCLLSADARVFLGPLTPIVVDHQRHNALIITRQLLESVETCRTRPCSSALSKEGRVQSSRWIRRPTLKFGHAPRSNTVEKRSEMYVKWWNNIDGYVK